MALGLTQKGQPGEQLGVLAPGKVGLAVTGVDTFGHVFRERTTVLALNERVCKYESKYDVQAESWVLLEIDYSEAGRKPCRVQGQVKSVSVPESADQPFQVTVELQLSQPVKVEGDVGASPLAAKPAQAPERPKPPKPPERQVESVSPQRTPAAPTAAEVQAPPRPGIGESSVKAPGDPEQLQNIRAQVLPTILQTAKGAVASEINRHLGVLKDWVSQEVEKALQGDVGLRLDRVLHQAVEKRIADNMQATVEAINDALVRQLVARLAESEELRSSITSAAQSLAARLSELSQTIAKKTEKDLVVRVAAVQQAFERSVAETQCRLEEMRARVEADLARAQEAKRDAATQSLSLQEALDRFQQVGRTATEELEKRHAANWEASLTAFKKAANETSLEMASRFASEIEQQLTPHLQSAEEKTDKLAALLQLAQGTMRVQEQELADASQAAMANLEKEINALFLRLSGNT